MNLKIKEPCHENWDKMSISIHGRHCMACEKQVVDFTSFTRLEIILYLLEHPNDKTCGRLRRDQFDFHQEDLPILMQALEKPKFRSNAFLLLAIVCAGLVSCGPYENEAKELEKPKTTKTELTVLKSGDSLVTKPSDTLPSGLKKHIIRPEILTGEVSITPGPEPVIMGGIEPPEPPPAPEPETIQRDSILDFAEVMPEFVGGMSAMAAYFREHLVYPTNCKELEIQGKVFVRFVVHSDGSISSSTVARGVHPELDRAALNLIKEMPKWIPGSQAGKKVAVRYILPVHFKLD
jgi:TonB family protein